MLQAYISNDNQHLKRFDKQKIISAAVYWEMQYSRFNGLNAFERVPRRLFIQSSPSHVRLLLGAPFRLNAVKHCIFRKSAGALKGYLRWRSFD